MDKDKVSNSCKGEKTYKDQVSRSSKGEKMDKDKVSNLSKVEKTDKDNVSSSSKGEKTVKEKLSNSSKDEKTDKDQVTNSSRCERTDSSKNVEKIEGKEESNVKKDASHKSSSDKKRSSDKTEKSKRSNNSVEEEDEEFVLIHKSFPDTVWKKSKSKVKNEEEFKTESESKEECIKNKSKKKKKKGRIIEEIDEENVKKDERKRRHISVDQTGNEESDEKISKSKKKRKQDIHKFFSPRGAAAGTEKKKETSDVKGSASSNSIEKLSNSSKGEKTYKDKVYNSSKGEKTDKDKVSNSCKGEKTDKDQVSSSSKGEKMDKDKVSSSSKGEKTVKEKLSNSSKDEKTDKDQVTNSSRCERTDSSKKVEKIEGKEESDVKKDASHKSSSDKKRSSDKTEKRKRSNNSVEEEDEEFVLFHKSFPDTVWKKSKSKGKKEEEFKTESESKEECIKNKSKKKKKKGRIIEEIDEENVKKDERKRRHISVDQTGNEESDEKISKSKKKKKQEEIDVEMPDGDDFEKTLQMLDEELPPIKEEIDVEMPDGDDFEKTLQMLDEELPPKKEKSVEPKILLETFKRETPAEKDTASDTVSQAKSSLEASTSTPSSKSESLLWVDKYKPTSLKKIIGQQDDKSNAKKLYNWLTNWHENQAACVKPQGLEQDQLALSSWGLPETVLKQYHSRDITHMLPWQAQCLLSGNVLGGGNLIYSAPTSAGKTMVAELLVLKKVLETRKKAIIILPFVSVTRERMLSLQQLYQDAGIQVGGYTSHHAPSGGFSSVDVAVCTIEKGNSLVNRMLEENKLDQLGIVVVDELHLLGDSHRGYLLELLLTKICYMMKKTVQDPSQNQLSSSQAVQIVGTSVALPNLDLLARWLKADLFHTDYRPVPLTECVKIGSTVYDKSMTVIRTIDPNVVIKGDDDHVIPLCVETLRENRSILIFCPTKNWCEKLAEMIAREFYNMMKSPAPTGSNQGTGFVKASNLLVLPIDRGSLLDVVEQLRRSPVGLDPILGKTIPYGVAYHHAGLTFDERDIVEGAFRKGILRVLIATSTLSSSVNLPAQRVLIRTPVFHGTLIDFQLYKQMIGRAGRKGVDTAGESILLCKPNEKSMAVTLMKSTLPPVHSTLVNCQGEQLSSSMKRAILEVVASGVASTIQDVADYVSCTLLAMSLPKDGMKTDELIKDCISFLQENEFVTLQKITNDHGSVSERYVPTQLGSAVLASALSPDEGLIVFAELQKARQCFVLENELHIIYLVTPIYAKDIGANIDWYRFYSLWEKLPADMKRVAELVGVDESFIAKAVCGKIPSKTVTQLKFLAIHKRFYTALVLNDLVQEVPLTYVAQKFSCNKGQLQSLQQSAATFAGMVTVFSNRLGWSNLELLLSQFQSRLTFGVHHELIDLVRISSLNGKRARILFDAGYQTVASLASAQPTDVEAVLKNSIPFQSLKKQENETEWDAEQRRKMHCIKLTGRKGITEAAEVIIEEAKSIIQDELGGLVIKWTSEKHTEILKSSTSGQTDTSDGGSSRRRGKL